MLSSQKAFIETKYSYIYTLRIDFISIIQVATSKLAKAGIRIPEIPFFGLSSELFTPLKKYNKAAVDYDA